MLVMLALGARLIRTQTADAHDARFEGQLMLVMLALGARLIRTQTADAHDARFGGRVLKDTGN